MSRWRAERRWRLAAPACVAGGLGLALGCDDDVRLGPGGIGAGDAGAALADAAAPDVPGAPGGGTSELENVALGDEPLTDMRATAVLRLLETACGDCHANGNAVRGIGDFLNVPSLIERGLIVPGSRELSRLYTRVRDGLDPLAPAPPSSFKGLLGFGDVELIGAFIDNLSTQPAAACEPSLELGQDAVQAALLADLLGLPSEERASFRYVDLTYASNAGLCGDALEQQRRALFKSLNATSRASSVSVPVATDATGLLHRVDLRAYGWDRPIDVDGDGSVDFPDAWQAVVAAAGPYAVERSGPEADAVRAETGTSVALLPGNALVASVNQGALYYALIGERANLYDTQIDLGIDYFSDPPLVLERAGFTAPYRNSNAIDYGLYRVAQGSAGRAYWAMEVWDEIRGNSLYADPLGIGIGDNVQAIYHLPNGFLAFAAMGRDGQRALQLPIYCRDCDRPETLLPAACHSCHEAGLLPVKDGMRQYVEENAAQYDRETLSDVLVAYVPTEQLAARLAADNERYRAALEQAGVPRGTPDPIGPVFYRFQRVLLDLRNAAAELGVTPAELERRLPELPALAPVASGAGLNRAVFEAALPAARCLLDAAARNRPAGCP